MTTQLLEVSKQGCRTDNQQQEQGVQASLALVVSPPADADIDGAMAQHFGKNYHDDMRAFEKKSERNMRVVENVE